MIHRWKAMKNKNKPEEAKNSKRKHTFDSMSFGTLAIGSPLKKKCSTPASNSASQSDTHNEFIALAYSSKNVQINAVPKTYSKLSPQDNAGSDSSSTTISADDESSSEGDDAQNPTSTSKWLPEHDKALNGAIRKYGEGQWAEMKTIKALRHFSVKSISSRWQHIKPNVKGPWSADEDTLLRKFVKAYGTETWAVIACHIPGRSGKQCRERWKNHLDPKLKKTEWSKKEDALLMKSQLALGNKWSEIAKKLGGRSENAVKNRYYSIKSRGRNGSSPRSRSPRSHTPRNTKQKRPKSTPTVLQMSSAAFENQSYQPGAHVEMPSIPMRKTSKFTTTCNYLRLSHQNYLNKRYESSDSGKRPQSRIMESTYNFLGLELRRSMDSAVGRIHQPAQRPESDLKQALRDKNEEIARLRVAISEVLDENLELRKQESTVCTNAANEDDSSWNSSASDDSESEKGSQNQPRKSTPPDVGTGKSYSPPTIVRKGKTARNKLIAAPTPIVIPADQDVKTANTLLTLCTPK